MHLQIFTYGEIAVDAAVKSVTLPGVAGQITPMEGHDRLVTILEKGKMFFMREEEVESGPEHYEIGGGIAEISHHAVNIFTSEIRKKIETSREV
jgi:F0F1-type ATP synthase epsilon subunit